MGNRSSRRQPCSFPNCDRLEHRFSGLCTLHYRQRERGLDLMPIGYYSRQRPRYVPPQHVDLCSVDGCEHVAKTRGFCDAHYWRMRHGKPMDVVKRQGEPMRRLLHDLVHRDRSECWTDWPYASHKTHRDTYRPKIGFEGKSVRVAQLVVAITYGTWPEHACHSCNVAECYNPAHIYPGDAQTNAEDRVQRRLA